MTADAAIRQLSAQGSLAPAATPGTRCMYRYTVPVDDEAWTQWLTGDPVHVGNGATPDEVEFWAEHTGGAPRRARRFRVFGTGHPLPPDARYVGTCPRTPEGIVWHLYELTGEGTAA